jgi:hypothetical protein
MPHPRVRLCLIPVLTVALVSACKDQEVAQGQGEVGVGKAAPSPAEEPEAKAEQPAPPGDAGEPTNEPGEAEDDQAAALPALPDSFDELGIEVCDDYVRDYVACIEKAPEAEREAQRRIVFENLEAWKQTATGGKAAAQGLQTACRIAREQAKRASQEWDCTW